MDQWLFGRSDDFLDHPGGRCRRTLKSVGTLKYFDEIGVFRDFLENQRDDRGRTIRVIRSQWNEKRGSMLFGRSDDFLDHPGVRCRRTLKSVGTLKYFDEIAVFRDFLENQRVDRGRTIRVIRSQWNENVDQWLFGRSDDFLDHPGGRCRRTLKSVGL